NHHPQRTSTRTPNLSLHQTGHGAPRHDAVDPRATRERLSVTPLSHRTNLTRKLEGKSSMSGKPRGSENAEGLARQDSDGRVKAELLEPQCPFCKGLGLDTAFDIQGFPRNPKRVAWGYTLRGGRPAMSGGKDTKAAPKPFCSSTADGTRDS